MMTESQKQFNDWLMANYLFDTSNFIKDESDREKAKAQNPTWMAWQHQQQRIDELEKKLSVVGEALEKANEKLRLHLSGSNEYLGGMPTQFLFPMIDEALKQIEATS